MSGNHDNSSEERLKRVLDTDAVGVLFFDYSGTLIDANDAFLRMTGYTREQVTSKSLHWRDLASPEYISQSEEEMKRLDQTRRIGPYEKEYVMQLRSLNEELEECVADRTRELQAEVHERRAGEERIKNLLQKLVRSEEQQRRRIARELHDTFGQQLAALHMNIEVLRTRVDGDATMRENIERMRETFDRLNSSVDFLAWELRPPSLDLLGLDAAMESYVKEWSQQFGVEAVYAGVGVSGFRFDPEAEINVYRIFQEALQNVHKHAGATRVNVVFERSDGHAVLIIEDNGKGYDTEAPDHERSMGLINMRERAALIGGSLEVESQAGEGTTVFVRVPVVENGNK